MKLKTKYFGEVEFDMEQAIEFPVGILGFADENQFALLPFAESANSMLCMQSVKTPGLAFVLLDPFSFCPDYLPVMQEEELKEMQAEKAEDLYFYVLCAVRNPVAESTVNMRCPIAVNPHTLKAKQIIMDAGKYEMRQLLSSFDGKQGGA